MAPTSRQQEPTPGAGSAGQNATVLGANPLTQALSENTQAAKALTQAIKSNYGDPKELIGRRLGSGSDDSYQSWQTPGQRRASQASPTSVAGWDPGSIAGQPVLPSQAPFQGGRTTPGLSTPTLAAQMPRQSTTPPQSPTNTFSSWPTSSMSQRPTNGGQTSLPSLPSGVYGGLGGLRPPGGGGSGSVPPGTPTPSGSGGGGSLSGTKNFLNDNKGAIGVGAAAGVVQAGATALNNYSTRNLNQNFDQFGNLYVLKNGGYSGESYGAASKAAQVQFLPAANEATSTSDLIGGSAQILANAGGNATFASQLSNAAVSASLSPGLGIQGAANIQQQEGTNQANVVAMMMFGQGTRTAGGGQISDVQLANNVLNATMMGKSTSGITPDVMKDMLSQTGTLRANLTGYAQQAGLGPDAVDNLANILTAQSAYQNKFGSTQGFNQTVTSASQGDKSAISKLKGTGIDESVQQSIETRQGAQINRDVDTQAQFIDALKASNTAMTNFSNSINSFLKGSGLGGLLGGAGGINAGTGGRIGGALGYAAGGAVVGTMLGGPGIGTAVGAGVGAIAGFISGGAAHSTAGTSTPNQGQNASAASSGTSQAANAAIAYAQAQVGKPYVMGAVGPNAYDCSGLTQAAYRSAGVSIPRVSSAQYQSGTPVPLDQIAPGDLVFPTGEDGMWGAPPGLPGHVMMALGPGPNVPIVEAGSPSSGIYDTTINISQIKGARRVTNGVGSISPNLNKTSTSSSSSSSDGSDSGGGSGAPATNTSMPAGAAQTSAPAALGMNEVDILGSVLGRAAWQGPTVSPSSAQSITMSGAVNGSALALPSFDKGALNIKGDQVAEIHDGEMLLDSKLGRSVRSSILADIPNHTNAGAKTSPTLNFSSGSVVINVSGGATQSAMQTAGKQFVDAVAADNRIQTIGAGL